MSIAYTGFGDGGTAVAASGNSSVTDGFENYDSGTTPGGDWEDTGTAPSEVTMNQSYEGDKSLQVGTSSNNGKVFYRNQSVHATDIDVSVTMYSHSTSETRFALHPEGTDDSRVIVSIVGGDLQIYDGSFTVIDSNVNNNEWVTVQINNVDPSNDTFSLRWESPNSSGEAHDIGSDGTIPDGNLDPELYSGAEAHFDQFGYGIGLGGFSEPITGTVVDQHGDPVDNATVEAWGIAEPALDENDARSLKRQAEDLRDELADPIPEQWDADYDLDAHMDADGTYALVHSESDWGVSSWSTSVSSNVDDPRLQIDSDQTVVISLWDPAEDGGWFDNQVDNSFPGSTTDGEITIRQLGPTGESIDSTTYETEVIATTTGGRITGENEHHGVRTRLPPGVYQAVPEGHPERGYTFVVGDPDELWQAFESDLRDEANRLTGRAERIQSMLQEETIVRETARTDENGEFEIDIASDVVTADVRAMKADGTILDGLEDPSLDDLREAQAGNYNGSFYLPSPTPNTVEPPAEDVQVTVYRSPEVPLGDMQSLSELLAWLEDQRLNETIEDLQSEYDQRFEEMERSTLERIYSNHRMLVETVPGAEGRYLDRSSFGEIQDAESLSTNELSTETTHMQVALANVDQIEPPELPDSPDNLIDLEDGHLSGETPLPPGVDEDTIAVELLPANGQGVETIPEEYWHVESGLFGDNTIVVEDYPVQATDAPAYTLRVRAGSDEGYLDDRIPFVNPGFDGEIPGIRAIDLNTLSPGPNERVSMTLRTSEDTSVDGIDSIDVFGPNGEELNTTIDGDTTRFSTNGKGKHFIRLAITDETGSTFVRSFSVRALEQSRSDPPTVRAEQSTTGPFAIAGEGLDDAEIAVDGDEIRVRAIVPGGEIPGSIHVKPDAVMDGDTHEIDIAVLEGTDERQISTNVEAVIHLDSIAEDADVWRGSPSLLGQPIKWDGGSRYGEVIKRENGKAIVRTYTNDDGATTITIEEDPDTWRSAQYSIASRIPRFDIPFIGSIATPSAFGGMSIGAIGISLVVHRRRTLP
ncbi:hypothetical protein [Halosolutus gelatinilyticus]|uniref:hypothetical protein n=1 Tax=Halosolutus gelatinilyticus TaxID=2931975 RepID=UPI001FF4E3F0|nr:hypothetical protein [Halosolutus gelatinilyticus]